MKLMYSKLSPFVRKVLVAAAEKDLTSQLEIVPAAVGHGKTNVELMQLNPIGKIPTLITDDGEVLYDSFVIIDYFDSLMAEPRLIPLSGAERRRVLRLNALGDGLIIAGVLAKTESSRPQERQWPELLTAQWAKVTKCLEALETELGGDHGAPTLGHIAAGCALGWLSVRAPEEAWQERHPKLAEWFAVFGERPSMVISRPMP